MSEKKHKPDPDDLTAPLYEDGEKPKFDSSLLIVIGSVVLLLILGALFFIFSDKIKQWTGNHHPTVEQAAPQEVTPTVPDSATKEKESVTPDETQHPPAEHQPAKEESHPESKEPVHEKATEEHHDHSSENE
jgi:cytoskeletal protein RodZ